MKRTLTLTFWSDVHKWYALFLSCRLEKLKPKRWPTRLIRTPNCDVAGFCYFTDMTNPIPPPCTLTGLVQVGNYCYQLHAPCQQGATQIGNWCYRLPLKGAQLAQTRDIILTGAKVVFVASCSTTDVFSGWWDLTLNAPPGGRALVVPDLATMASLGVNQPPKVPPQNLASIDLVQGTIGYEAFLNTLATPNKTLQDAVNAANSAIAAIYPTLDYSHNIGGQLPQVVYAVAKGNSNLCINCGRSQ